MELQTMSGPYCFIYSFAMALGIPVKELISEIGHDGTEIIWPKLEGNMQLRGHHIDEIIDVCLKKGVHLVNITYEPSVSPWIGDVEPKQVLFEARFWDHIRENKSVIVGEIPSGYGHAVACDGKQIYDPRGRVLTIDRHKEIFKSIEQAWLVL